MIIALLTNGHAHNRVYCCFRISGAIIFAAPAAHTQCFSFYVIPKYAHGIYIYAHSDIMCVANFPDTHTHNIIKTAVGRFKIQTIHTPAGNPPVYRYARPTKPSAKC